MKTLDITFRWQTGRLSIGPLPEPLVYRLGCLVGLTPEPADPGTAPDLPVVRDEAGGCALRFGPQVGLFRCGGEEGLLLHLALSVHELLLSGEGWHVVHGAALVLDGQAWLFLGPSRAGKSTLAAEAWLQGVEVIGDDTALLHAVGGGEVEAVPKPLKIRLAAPVLPERLAGRLTPGDDAAWALGVAYGDLALLLGRAVAGIAPVGRRYPLGGAVVLDRDEGRPGWRIARADRLALVRAVIEQTFVGPERGFGGARAISAPAGSRAGLDPDSR